MKKIFQHIENLLAKHDYVVVPNLGGFVVQKQSAIILPDSIKAPKYMVGFNPLMKHSDGLLALEIAKSESISFRKAVECIDNEVQVFLSSLKSSGQLAFGKLGVFRYNDDRNLIFTPNSLVEFLPQNLGLTDIYISKLDIADKIYRKTVTFKLPSTTIYKYAAAGMLIFGLMFITPEVNDVRHSATADFSNLVSLNATKKINEPKETTAKIISETVTTNDTAINDIKIQEEKYHVIVASLANEKNAQEYCETLKKDSFIEARVLTPSKIYRVAIHSFADRDIAIKYMENLRKSDSRFETAWVLCN